VFNEDLTVFFNTDEHAITATYTPPGYAHPGDATISIDGILDRNAYDANPGGSLEVSGVRSVFMGIRSDFVKLGTGGKLRDEDGNDYRITLDDQDETGTLVTLMLEAI